ncbi:MAG TPA: DUF3048 domain-containing protein [Egibacteraceae bacterium]|nr:DUF3048 domain-containing protein [Egibacteraceae bacterium]
MRRLLLAVAIFAVIFAGVAALLLLDDELTATDPPDEGERVVAPLTGLEVDNGRLLDRSVVALKIDNAPLARPPLGLELADITFTELVEGGHTRFIALYHSVLPEQAGPVRSGRDVDAQILPAFSPVFGISGAADPTYVQLRGSGLLVYEEGQAGAFYREGSRPAPHNLFASAEALGEAAADLPPASAPWPFDATVPEGGQQAAGVRLVYSPFYRASWHWDADRDAWLRNQEGGPHTHAGQDQLSADTVVVARVTAVDGLGVDIGGNPVPEVNVLGEGEATVLRDGRRYPARWRKDGADTHFEWLTAEGDPLPLRPGRTWVELVPDTGSVDVATTGIEG